MWTMIALLGVEIVLLAIFAPIKVSVQAYFCLERKIFMADIKVFRLTVAKIRAKLQDGKILLVVNNKRMPFKPTEKQNKRIGSVARYVRAGNLKIKGDMLAMLGGENTMVASLVAGTICVVGSIFGQKPHVYSGYSDTRADTQIVINTKISIFQTIEMMIEG